MQDYLNSLGIETRSILMRSLLESTPDPTADWDILDEIAMEFDVPCYIDIYELQRYIIANY